MNMLYEAIKEEGLMVIVPSSARSKPWASAACAAAATLAKNQVKK